MDYYNISNCTFCGQSLSTADAEIIKTTVYDVTGNQTSPANREQEIVIAVIISLLAVWSLIGNSLTILAITTQENMMTKCNYFILSLAVSDLMSAMLASPLWLYRRTWGFHDWRWGRFLCKLFWAVDESTSYCTAMHIASFSVWRLIGVKWSRRFEAIKKRSVAICLGILWVLAIIFGGFVFSLFYDVAEKTSNTTSGCWPMCSIRLKHNGIEEHKIYYTFSSSTFLLFPMGVLLVASALIVRELRNKKINKSVQRKAIEKKAALQLALIATSFLVGYIPMTTYVMWTTRRSSSTNSTCLLDYWVHVGAYFCLRFSECINPLMYNIASKKMRKASLNVLWKIRTCFRYENKRVESYSKEPKKTAAIAKSSFSPKHQVQSNSGVAFIDFLSNKKDKWKKNFRES